MRGGGNGGCKTNLLDFEPDYETLGRSLIRAVEPSMQVSESTLWGCVSCVSWGDRCEYVCRNKDHDAEVNSGLFKGMKSRKK